jgi:phosphatidate cytidylyltransferase
MKAASPASRSDLRVRTLSAILMLAVAGGALWLGGWAWAILVGLVAFGVLFEWRRLVFRIAAGLLPVVLWNLAGIIYIGFAAAMLLFLRSELFEPTAVLTIILAVIATDVGAFFAGRTIGGPKIAPSISPSKTWAGLGGGIVCATLAFAAMMAWTDQVPSDPAGEYGFASERSLPDWPQAAFFGTFTAVIAQAGDFFESWMKRRAGVKDSGFLLPGHGGLFDRVDGLLAVLFVGGVFALSAGLLGLN